MEKKIGTIFREARERNNLEIKDVLDLLENEGISIKKQTMYCYETNTRSMTPDTFLALCKIYKIKNILQEFKDVDSDDSIPTDKEWSLIEKYRTLDKYGTQMVDGVLDCEYARCSDPVFRAHEENVRYINYYLTPASAGSGQILYHDVPVEQIAIPDEYDLRLVAYAVRANGDSMEPAFSDGDILLVEPAVDLMPGEIGIFYVDGSGYVKKLGDGKLLSLNPAYGPIRLTEDSRCMGRVVGKL